MKDYLGFRKWYNANKGNFKNEETNEKIAWAAWSAAKEQAHKENDDKDETFYLDLE